MPETRLPDPTPGRVVHYVLPSGVHRGEVRPMIVERCDPEHPIPCPGCAQNSGAVSDKGCPACQDSGAPAGHVWGPVVPPSKGTGWVVGTLFDGGPRYVGPVQRADDPLPDGSWRPNTWHWPPR